MPSRRSPGKNQTIHAPEAAREAAWVPPLRRHGGLNGGPGFITICVRVLSGDSEHDFNAKFAEGGQLLAGKVCSAIAGKEGLSDAGKEVFALWIVGKDLEIQLRPDLDIFEVMKRWHLLVLQYTHYPEAIDCFHPINRHWFVYRREATTPRSYERTLTEDAVIRLLYGEAKRNVMTSRYLCTPEDAATLGGMLLQVAFGNYDPQKHTKGYLSQGDQFFRHVLPYRLHGTFKPKKWEQLLMKEHQKNAGRGEAEIRHMYLEFVRRWACYGCSFFPVCKDKPPHGFFEFRLQQMSIGVGPEGVVVMDLKRQNYVVVTQWSYLTWKHSDDKIFLNVAPSDKETDGGSGSGNGKSGKKGKIAWKFYTPQAKMIHNLAVRCKYLYLKRMHEMSVGGPAGPVSTAAATTMPITSVGMSVRGAGLVSARVSGTERRREMSAPVGSLAEAGSPRRSHESVLSGGVRRLSVGDLGNVAVRAAGGVGNVVTGTYVAKSFSVPQQLKEEDLNSSSSENVTTPSYVSPPKVSESPEEEDAFAVAERLASAAVSGGAVGGKTPTNWTPPPLTSTPSVRARHVANLVANPTPPLPYNPNVPRSRSFTAAPTPSPGRHVADLSHVREATEVSVDQEPTDMLQGGFGGVQTYGTDKDSLVSPTVPRTEPVPGIKRSASASARGLSSFNTPRQNMAAAMSKRRSSAASSSAVAEGGGGLAGNLLPAVQEPAKPSLSPTPTPQP
ncbi:FERM domain-containing protein 8, partial [Rhizophlyctis rosea]